MKYSGKARINEEKNPGSRSTRNMHGVDNVNQAAGPRTGNTGTPGKRSAFGQAKQAGAGLADMIARAFGARAPEDRVNSRLEPISSTSRRQVKR